MAEDWPLTPDRIASEYDRLGHRLGWRFLTSAERNLRTASVALVTINPGGGRCLSPQWSCEDGNAYATEDWLDGRPGEHPLQRQVGAMFKAMDVDIETVLSGYLVPFRSPKWSDLKAKEESLRFGAKLWRRVFEISPANLVVAFGMITGDELAKILKVKPAKFYPAGWGNLQIRVHAFGEGKTMMVLPHLSRFRLFSNCKSIKAFHVALAATRGTVAQASEVC